MLGVAAKFAEVCRHSRLAHNHFNQERHLYGRNNFSQYRTATLAKLRQLCTGKAGYFPNPETGSSLSDTTIQWDLSSGMGWSSRRRIRFLDSLLSP